LNPEEKQLGSSQAGGSGEVLARIKRAGEEEFSETRPAATHTEYQKRASSSFHIHWRISSGEHGPDAAGNIALGMIHDIIAPDRQAALEMARVAAPDHREFIVNAQYQHHAHPSQPDGGSH